jgi:hypothetical protein
MHRSGTSAVARVLSLLGADLPKNLIAPASDNPRGFWESTALWALHEELLAALGSSWDDWTRLPADLFETQTANRFRARLLALLEADFAESHLFVLKDPRMCRLVPFWRGVLREFGASIRVVIPVRNPLEVAASLSSRDGFSTPRGLLIWLRHVLDAERETRDLPRRVIRFADLLHDHRRVLAAMRRGLGVAWPQPASAVRPEIAEFLSAAERHHSADDASFAMNADVPSEVRRAYEALGVLAVENDSPQAQAELDQIGSDLDRAAALFGPIVTELAMTNRTQRTAIDDLQRSSGESAAQVDVLREEVATARSGLLEQRGEAERMAGELAGARAELTAMRGELTESQAVLASRLSDIHNLTGQVSALRTLVDARTSEIGQLREAAAASTAARDASVAESRVQLETLRAAITDREAVLAQLREQLSAAHAQLDYMVHSVSWRLMAPLRAVRRRLGHPPR